jgi:hypothetical protein
MRAMAKRSKRIGSAVLMAFAVAGCRGGIPSSIVVGNGIPTDVSGTWTMQWGPLTGSNDYTDTTFVPVGGGKDSLVITQRTASDTCTASATFTLAQSTPAAYLSGPYKMIRTCDGKTDTVQTTILYGALTADRTVGLTLEDSKDTVLNLRKPDTVVVNDTVVAGKKDTTINTRDTVALAAHALQSATLNGTQLSGSASWTLLLRARPAKTDASVIGSWTASKQ